MRDLNIDFMDLYKRADRFIKDAYSSSEGVSEYIRLMEADFIKGSSKIQGWKRDYDNLKHIRWIRNQLAHEVSYDSEICSVNEYEWLEEFYERLLSTEDPLTALKRIEKKAASERVGKRQSDNIFYQTPRDADTDKIFYQTSKEDPLAELRKIEMKAARVRVGKRQPDNNSYQTPRKMDADKNSYKMPRKVYTPPRRSRSNKRDGCLIAFVIITIIIIAILIFVPWL